MARAHKVILTFITFALIWSFLVLTDILKGSQDLLSIVKAFPGYSLMVFGCFALFTIGRDLYYLKDYPKEQESLVKEIEEAKQFYKTKNIQ